MMVPLRPVAPRHRWFLGFCFFVLFFALWALVTFTGLVAPTFLASPASMVQEGVLLFTDFDFTTDIGMTVMRVLGGLSWPALSPCRWVSGWAHTNLSKPSSSRLSRFAAICQLPRLCLC
jgi:hypothetical protein